MTHSSDPRRPKSSRKKSSREPATIDLKATVIDEGTPQTSPGGSAQDTVGDTIADVVGEAVRASETAPEAVSAAPGPDAKPEEASSAEAPEETIAASSESPAETGVTPPEATIDSGSGTDTLPPDDSMPGPGAQDTLTQETVAQESPAQEPPAQETRAGTLPPPAAPERRSSAGALIGSGLLGGLVGAGLLYGLQTWQASQAQDDPRIAQLEQRMSALSRQPAPAPQGGDPALAERVQALESARGELDQRLQALQDTAQQAASQAEAALNRPLPEAPAAPAAPQNEAALAELSNRLGTLEEQVRTSAQTATGVTDTLQEVDRRIADLDRRFGEQEQRFAGTDQRLADLDRQLGDINRQVAETNDRFGETGRRIGDLEQRLAALSEQAAENTRNAEAASQVGTRVVLAGRLNDALRSGTPYADVLDGVKKAGADPAGVAPLEPFAQQGAPTAEALARSFEPLETAILRESRGPAEGWTDRLLRMADKVVTVRPVNEPGSNGVPATVVRIRQALEQGDVAEAAAAWDSLPEPARRLSEAWGQQVKAVAEAHRAAQTISADALATLNRTTQ